ncbi:hypothetical protein LSTR_LSTR016992 [Laodelphax striatellus]|uniref:Uncharacterized protein n=1 Tax=Laodelphax striatellus TaxID=195883 RepID=A0A482XDT2_LAOST|nr:hypothetical protein LSTR_LSTR016992 [Laodelphax striatellus]
MTCFVELLLPETLVQTYLLLLAICSCLKHKMAAGCEAFKVLKFIVAANKPWFLYVYTRAKLCSERTFRIVTKPLAIIHFIFIGAAGPIQFPTQQPDSRAKSFVPACLEARL